MSMLDGKVAVVTGASRGVGKGVAMELAQSGTSVYVTGRSAADLEYINGRGTALICDHRDDRQVAAAFQRILSEAGRIDILVNNVWAATNG
jgi:dehydrogenase/reductase SDR family member 1